MDLDEIITKYPPKQIILLPLAVIAIALIVLGTTYLTTGSPVRLGVEFTGGTLITVPASGTEEGLAEDLAGYPVTEIRSVGSRYMIQFGPMSDDDYTSLARLINSEFNDVEIRHMGPVYSKELQMQAIKYLPLSFLFMAIVVFILFREPFISAIVAFCAFADILIAAASMNLTGVNLSLGTVAALLMLIGYSVDTDILLTMRVTKRKGPVEERIIGAMGTGMMMTATSIAAVFSLFLVSNLLYLVVPSFTRMDIIADISTVLIFGLIADMFNTWITNAQGLRWYMKLPKKAVRRSRK